MLTELEARRKGGELLSRMIGTGWKLYVWENLGWHYCVCTANIDVFPAGGGTFTTLIDEDTKPGEKPSGGSSVWTHGPKNSTDPNKAARNAVNYAKKQLLKLQAAVDSCEMALDGYAQKYIERRQRDARGEK